MKIKKTYKSPANKKWTNEQLLIEAAKFSNHKDFKINSKHAYFCAQKRGILKEICKHMRLLGNRYRRLIYSFVFPDNTVYVGLTFQPEVRKYRHLTDPKSQVFKYIKKTNLEPKFEILSDYLDAQDASLKEKEFINKFKNLEYLILNKTNAGELGGNQYKWSISKIDLEASKFTSLKEFYLLSTRAYDAARRRGIIDLIKNKYYNEQ